MSTVLIVVIAVVAIAVIALLLLLPRVRDRARIREHERELDRRRDRVVQGHRDEASGRERRAAVAEQRARVAEQEAERERAEAGVEREKAKLHERGLADHELIAQDERENFSGTSAVEEPATADPGLRSAADGDPGSTSEPRVEPVASQAGSRPVDSDGQSQRAAGERRHSLTDSRDEEDSPRRR